MRRLGLCIPCVLSPSSKRNSMARPLLRAISTCVLHVFPAPPSAKAKSKFSPCFARKQNQNFLRASRESEIKSFSALCAKAKSKISPRFARKQNLKNFSALRAKANSQYFLVGDRSKFWYFFLKMFCRCCRRCDVVTVYSRLQQR